MADNVLVDNGTGTDYTVSSDEGAGGHVQRVKLAYSADGSETHVAADADGLLVNLGTNNDTTVTALTPGTAAGNLGKAEDAGHTTGDTGVMLLGVRNDTHAALSGTDLDYTPIAVDAEGDVKVIGAIAHDSPVGSGDPPVRIAAYAKAAAPSDVSADADVVNLWALRNGALAVNVTAAGALIPGDASNGLDIDVTRIAAGTNAIGNVGIIPRTTGGLTTYHLASAASTNATNVKASAGQLMGWYVYNSNASMRKLAFHNTAGTPTAGASIFFTLPLPPSSAANVMLETGIAFSSGIGITTVTGLADSDSTGVAANDLIINLFYT
jgi:hypothetical protein